MEHTHLAVRKDADVEAIHRALYQVLGVLKHVALAAARIKHLYTSRGVARSVGLHA